MSKPNATLLHQNWVTTNEEYDEDFTEKIHLPDEIQIIEISPDNGRLSISINGEEIFNMLTDCADCCVTCNGTGVQS